MADRIGQHIDDYRLIRLLGTGSFGEVYLGEHLDDRTLVAVKMLSLNQENWREFVKEVGTTFRLKHPHIIALLAFGMSADDVPYLVMDYAPNGTLRQRHPKGTPLPLNTIISYLLPLAGALQYAHDRRVIHRDIKPENVLIGQDGKVLLSDFGIAVITPIEQSLKTQSMGGTAPYMAPEQIRGRPHHASDQYALGIMAYEWLCGTRPFQGTIWEILDQHRSHQPPPLREMLPDLPPIVEEIILRALAKDPQERFARVLDFANALEQANHVGEPSPPLSSSSLLPTPSLTNAASQAEQASDSSAIPQPEQAPDMSANPQPEQVSSKLPSRKPLADKQQPHPTTNLAPSPPTALSPIAPVTPFFSSRPISFPRTPQPVFVPSRPSTVHRGPIRKKLILFVGLLLIIVGGSVFLCPAVINSLVKFYPSATAPTNTALSITTTAAALAYTAGTTKTGVMFGFDPAHTHWNPYEKVLNRTNVSHLKPEWSYTIHATDSSPVVADGVIYVGSDDDKLYAFNASCHSACQPLWSYAAGSYIHSSPAVANGIVYVGSDDYKFYAFDATCHRACQPLWSYATHGGINFSLPTIANGIVYVGSEDDKLYAFDASCRSACQPLWSYATGSSIDSSPAVANGIVYVGSYDNKLYAFDAACRSACQPLWSYATGDIIYSSPAVANGIVYVGSDDGWFYAFDATCHSACQPLWSYPTHSIVSSPTVANGVVYIGSHDNKLYAFDASCRSACQPLWSYPTNGVIWSSAAVANGVLYVGSDDDKLYVFDATCRHACQPLWSYTTGNYIRSSPEVANGVVYAGSEDGKLYAFGITS